MPVFETKLAEGEETIKGSEALGGQWYVVVRTEHDEYGWPAYRPYGAGNTLQFPLHGRWCTDASNYRLRKLKPGDVFTIKG